MYFSLNPVLYNEEERKFYKYVRGTCVTSKPRRFFARLEGMKRKGYGRTYSIIVYRKYTHSGACCESNALLWLQNIQGQRSERTL